MADIIPAILSKDVYHLNDKFFSLPSEVTQVHIDIVEDRSLWANLYGKDLEIHFMISDPLELARHWLDISGVKRLIFHVLSPEILALKDRAEIGLAIEMHVPIESVEKEIEQADFVQLMSIAQIGSQGQPFDERIFDRIKEVKQKFPSKILSVDGGINAENAQRLIDAGADRLVVGSHFNEVWTSQMKR